MVSWNRGAGVVPDFVGVSDWLLLRDDVEEVSESLGGRVLARDDWLESVFQDGERRVDVIGLAGRVRAALA